MTAPTEVAGLADAVEIGLPRGRRLGDRRKRTDSVDLRPIEIGIVDLVRPHLHERAADPDIGDHQPGDGAGRDAAAVSRAEARPEPL